MHIYKKIKSTEYQKLNLKPKDYWSKVKLYQKNYLDFLPRKKDVRILEIGCGVGQFIKFLEKQGYHNYLGIDFNEEAIKFCKDEVSQKVKLIDDLEDFLKQTEQFDLIVVNDLFNYLESEQVFKILEKIKEHLKVDGQLIFKVKNMANILNGYLRYNDFALKSGFTENSIRQLLLTAGFKRFTIKSYIDYISNLSKIIKFIGRKFQHFFFRFYYYLELKNKEDQPKILDEEIFVVVEA